MFWGVSDCFLYCTKVVAKLAELEPLKAKFGKQTVVLMDPKLAELEPLTRSNPLDPKLMFWGISDRFVTARKSTQNWLNWCH
jgi:hypothetical protein